jgi:hypothetical protein
MTSPTTSIDTGGVDETPVLAEDPLAGIPKAVRDLVGSYDIDTAGGCG